MVRLPGRFWEFRRLWDLNGATSRSERRAGHYDEAEAMYKKSLQLYWNKAAETGLELLAKERQGQASSR